MLNAARFTPWQDKAPPLPVTPVGPCPLDAEGNENRYMLTTTGILLQQVRQLPSVYAPEPTRPTVPSPVTEGELLLSRGGSPVYPAAKCR